MKNISFTITSVTLDPFTIISIVALSAKHQHVIHELIYTIYMMDCILSKMLSRLANSNKIR